MAIPRKKKTIKYDKNTIIQPIKMENYLKKQMLEDLEKRISLNVGNFLVLSEEGDPTQIALAHQKAKSEFLKFGPEMHKIAQTIGGNLQYAVADFLDSIDIVLHCAEFLDDDKISRCFHTTQTLEAELRL